MPKGWNVNAPSMAEERGIEVAVSAQTAARDFTDLIRVSVVPNPNGTQTEVWRSTTPASNDGHRYGRVRVTVP